MEHTQTPKRAQTGPVKIVVKGIVGSGQSAVVQITAAWKQNMKHLRGKTFQTNGCIPEATPEIPEPDKRYVVEFKRKANLLKLEKNDLELVALVTKHANGLTIHCTSSDLRQFNRVAAKSKRQKVILRSVLGVRLEDATELTGDLPAILAEAEQKAIANVALRDGEWFILDGRTGEYNPVEGNLLLELKGMIPAPLLIGYNLEAPEPTAEEAEGAWNAENSDEAEEPAKESASSGIVSVGGAWPSATEEDSGKPKTKAQSKKLPESKPTKPRAPKLGAKKTEAAA